MKAVCSFLLRYCRSENIRQYNWLKAFSSITWQTEFSQTWGLIKKIVKNEKLHSTLFSLKTIDKIFRKTQKTQSWRYFRPFLPHQTLHSCETCEKKISQF